MVPGRLARDTRVRAVILWVGLRTLLFFGFAFVGAFQVLETPLGGRAVNLLALLSGLWMFLWTVGLTATLVLLDLRVVRETLLFANLGVSQWRVLRLALVPVLALEFTLQLVLASVAP